MGIHHVLRRNRILASTRSPVFSWMASLIWKCSLALDLRHNVTAYSSFAVQCAKSKSVSWNSNLDNSSAPVHLKYAFIYSNCVQNGNLMPARMLNPCTFVLSRNNLRPGQWNNRRAQNCEIGRKKNQILSD